MSKAVKTVKSKFKILKYVFPFILISLLTKEIQAQPGTLRTGQLPKQNIIFDEVGKLASNLKYIHVAIPLNISTFYDQGAILEHYLKDLAKTVTTVIPRIPFTKAARDTGVWGLRKLSKIMEQVQNLDYILPHNETFEDRQGQDNLHKRLKRDLACLYGYSSMPKECDSVGEIASFFFNPIGALIKLHDDNHTDVKSKWEMEDKMKEMEISWYESQIKILHRKLHVVPKELPDSYLEGYVTSRPPVTTTTFMPWDRKMYAYESYLILKRSNRRRTYEQLKAEERTLLGDQSKLPDYYVNPQPLQNQELSKNRTKRFVQLFSLVNDVIGTFMGAFNAYEIQQLKKKFNELHSGHNSLVRITQQHDVDIKNLSDNMQSIMDVIDLMSEYNPSLLMMQIGEQLDIFKDRVIVLVNAVQQLHHRRLSVDLLTPAQMNILHQAVQEKAHEDGFNALATKISDYYQMEATYVRNDDKDIVIILHVPGTKEIDLLTIYRYLPFPMPIPMLPKTHDITIGQSLSNQNFSQAQLEQLFDQNDLDYPQEPEALFVTDDNDLIAVSADDKFQILSQVEMASCVKRNHIYLCDKNNVVKSDFTDTCLGSLYIRMEQGVRRHCKFERRPVQEMVYQLSDTDHLVFSPSLQSSSIKCTNGSVTRVHFEQSTKIHVPPGCSIKLNKHEITSSDSVRISPPPLRYSWSWDPFTLPSSLLSNPAHLDQAIFELRTNIYGMSKQINSTRTNSSTFEAMIVKENFKINYTATFIWIALALAATANLGLFIFTVIFFLKNRQTQNRQPHHSQQPQMPLNPIQHPAQPIIPENNYQLPQQFLNHLQEFRPHRQVNVNNNALALR